MNSLKIYLLPSGEFIVSYFDPIRKRRVQEKFADEISARNHYQDLRAPIPRKTIRSTDIGRLMTQYMEERPSCYLWKSNVLVRSFLDTFEFYAPTDITEIAMRAFLIQSKNENDYSDRTMLVQKTRLQGFFRFLIEKNIIESSPLDNIKFNRLAPFRRKPVVLELEEIREINRQAKKFSPVVFYPIFLLIQETGINTQDILSLQWKDMNFKTRVLLLTRSKELQPRIFVMSDGLVNAIRRIEPNGDRVFVCLERGRIMEKNILIRELRRFQRLANLSNRWSLRDLRTSFAAHLLHSGGSIKSLQKIMGHGSHHLTEEVYGRYQAGNAQKIDHSAAVTESGAAS